MLPSIENEKNTMVKNDTFDMKSTLMKLRLNIIIASIYLITASCKTTKIASIKDDGKIEVVLVQVNDVYEIAPLSGGKEGGMARVATIKKEYKKENVNTFLVMSGDFLSPSVYNSLQHNGKRIRGKQMVDAMNAAETDFAVFGNHEFDITETELQERINESDFQWISSNTFHKQNGQLRPFSRKSVDSSISFPKTYILKVRDNDGTEARIGFIGLTLPFNKADYVSYTDPISTAKQLYNDIKDSCDAVVAITHLVIADDIKLAKELPGLAAILGGHEHDMRFNKTGNVYITKAHANAKSAYIVKLNINKLKNEVTIKPELRFLNEKVPFDSITNAVVEKWTNIAATNYASIGFEPKKIVIQNGEPLNGKESVIRSNPSNLTQIITASMANACPEADVVIVNSGSIRVDDILSPPISQYDILRAMPFGGSIVEVDMKGSLLKQVLEIGRKNAGSGGYLLSQPVAFSNNDIVINDKSLDTNRIYRVALTDFLITGKEANLEFLNEKNPDIIKVYKTDAKVNNPKSDIRLAIIKYLEKQN